MTTPIDRAAEAIDQMARPLEKATAELHLSTQNRLGLMHCHGFIALTAGLLTFLFGSFPSLDGIIPAAQWITSLTPLAGGILLEYGLIMKPRRLRPEASGLSLILLWELMMTLGFLVAFVSGPIDFHFPWSDGIPANVAYPVPIYLGMLALVALHLVTVRQILRITRGPS